MANNYDLTKKQYNEEIDRWAKALYYSEFLPFYSPNIPTYRFAPGWLKKFLRKIAKAAFDKFAEEVKK